MPNKGFNIEDVHFYVTCPSCGAQFGITGKRPHMDRNCNRCGRGAFKIDISSDSHGQPIVHVSFEFNDYTTVPVTVERLTWGKDD